MYVCMYVCVCVCVCVCDNFAALRVRSVLPDQALLLKRRIYIVLEQ